MAYVCARAPTMRISANVMTTAVTATTTCSAVEMGSVTVEHVSVMPTTMALRVTVPPSPTSAGLLGSCAMAREHASVTSASATTTSLA